MGNRKITLLAAIAAASISATDVAPVVDADAGTPTTYKATMAVLRTGLLKAPGTGWDLANDYLTLGPGTAPTSGLIRASHGAITADAPFINSRVTWNAGGVAFRHLLFDVTDTASAAGSLLADFQVGGTSKWKVDKTGAMTASSTITSLGGPAWTTVPWLKAVGLPNTGAIEFGTDRPAGSVSWLLGSSAATLTLGSTTQRDGTGTVTAAATFTSGGVTFGGATSVVQLLVNAPGPGAEAIRCNGGIAMSGTLIGVTTMDASNIVLNHATTTGSSVGEMILGNAKSIRGAIAAGTTSKALIQLNSSNIVILAPDGDNTLCNGLLIAANGLTVSGTLITGLGSGSGVMSVGAADSGGAGFKLLRVPN